MEPSASRGKASLRCPCSLRRWVCTLQSACCRAGSSRKRAGSTFAAIPNSRSRPASSRPFRAGSAALAAAWAATAAADECTRSARRHSPGSHPGCMCTRCTSSHSCRGRTARRRTRRRGICGWRLHCGPKEAPQTRSCSCGWTGSALRVVRASEPGGQRAQRARSRMCMRARGPACWYECTKSTFSTLAPHQAQQGDIGRGVLAIPVTPPNTM